MLTHRDIRLAIERFLQSCEAVGVRPGKVLLFGSYAKGTAHQWSDVDLAVFSEDFVDNPFENNARIQGTERIPQLQLHLYPLRDFFGEHPFVEHVKEHAVEIPVEACQS